MCFEKLNGSVKDYLGNVCNKKMYGFAVFSISGFILLAISKYPIFNKIFQHLQDLFWVIGWSSMGIAASLFNRRGISKDQKEQGKKNRECQTWHYIFYYFLFSLFISSLAGYAIGRGDGGSLNYPLAALISLTIGFSAKRLNDLTLGV